MEATAQMVQSHKRSGFAEFAARVTAGASALLLLVLVVFKWYEARYELNIPGLDVADLGGEAAKPIAATAWEVSLLGQLVVVMAVIALLVAAIHLLMPRVRLPFSAPLALFVLGAVMAGLIVLIMFTDPDFAPAPEGFIPGFESNNVNFIYVYETQIGIYVSLAFAGLVALGGILTGIAGRKR
jgi:hypothetical protein